MAPSKILMCMDCGRPHYEAEPGAPSGLPIDLAPSPDTSATPTSEAFGAPDGGPPSPPSAASAPAESGERKCRYCGSTLIREQNR